VTKARRPTIAYDRIDKGVWLHMLSTTKKELEGGVGGSAEEVTEVELVRGSEGGNGRAPRKPPTLPKLVHPKDRNGR
jgi:hypothetical protein